MKCPFCQTNNTPSEFIGNLAIYKCFSHNNWFVEYTPDPTKDEPDAWYSILNDQYLIDVVTTNPSTTIFQYVEDEYTKNLKSKRQKVIFRFDHIIKVTPETASNTIERLLNLRAFL